MKRKLLTPLDIILTLFVIIISVFVMLFNINSDAGTKAVVSINEETVVVLKLSDNQIKRIETDNGYNIVVIQNGVCTVTEADCRDGICVKHSAINKIGQSIVCLPHKLIIEIK